MAYDHCFVCNADVEPNTSDDFHMRCSRCGEFKVVEAVVAKFLKISKPVQTSAYIREQNAARIVPVLDTDTLAAIDARRDPSLTERAERSLLYLTERHSTVHEEVHTTDPHWQAIAYSSTAFGLNMVAQVLETQGFITKMYIGNFEKWKLTVQAFLAADKLRSIPIASASGFVAMSFDNSMDEAYTNGFAKAIEDAGYLPRRIDRLDHINGVTDEIMSEIRRARFVVADYTGGNNGVYFEAGFALGRGIPVIGTCHKDHFDLHFDIKHINTLKWSSSAELRSMLSKRITAVLGDGPHRLIG